MQTEYFLKKLKERDIKLTLKNDRITCNAPTGVLTHEIITELNIRKNEIIRLLKNEAQDLVDAHIIGKVPQDRPQPLSFAQQRLWFLHKLEPQNPVYNITASRLIKGALNVSYLEKSICKVVERHEILRTIFPEINGTPVQVVTNAKPTLQQVNIEHFPIEKRNEEFQRWRQDEARRPFTTDAPMLRISLLRLTYREYHLVVVMHHIISDGWSLGIFFKELGEIYIKLLLGGSGELLDLPFQYGDYARWQIESFNDSDTQRNIEYWKEKLSGNLPVLELPTDRPRRPVQSSNGAVQVFKFSKEIKESLYRLEKKYSVTLFMILLTAFKILLHRYTTQTDIIIGTPIANRKLPELESLIGLFVNTLVLRTNLSGDPTVIELLTRIRDVVLEAHEHQDFPFEKIVELIRPERTLSHTPIFQVALILQNTPGSLEYDTVSAGAMFDISLFFLESEQDITGSFEYNKDLFEDGTITRMIGHLKTLARAIVKNPHEHISKLPLLTEAEKIQLKEWNETKTDYPRDLTIQELFVSQASNTPNSVALVFPRADTHIKSIELSYREVDRLTNKLARRLRSLGVGPEVCVGVAMDRCPDFITAILAVLKAGGAYVPIDLSYPKDRKIFMIEDADIQLLLTTTESINQVPKTKARILCLDQERKEISLESAKHLNCLVGAESLAYVMYTSGSTGRPKGVCVTHRNVIRLVKNTNYVSLSPQEVILACAPVSFDASTFEIWGSLLNGGRLVLYPGRVPTPAGIAKRVRENHVSTLWLTAGLFNLMVETQPLCFTEVRQLLAGGDVLSPAHVKKALEFLRNGVLINGYGPTENTTFTTCYRLETFSDTFRSVPIGRPISNTRVYVLDNNMRPVPVGVRGELWAGGDGVARGYLNDRDLTAQKFLSDPFNEGIGSRLYRTGDFVRFRPDGNLEFLNRIDSQVKISGFRVEPGEVEQLICLHPCVREAAVVARERDSKSKHLVAYVVPTSGSNPSIDDLRRFLIDRLPVYMVPTAMVMLEEMPLTPNGKVDLGNLPDPPKRHMTGTTPRNFLETQLLVIWESVLGEVEIGIRDNFFELGGHSLLALQLLVKMEKVFGRPFPLSTVFQAQSIEEMASAMMQDSLEFGGSLVTIKTGGPRPPVFFVPGVGGSALGFGELARLLKTDQPVFCLQSLGLDGNQDPLDRIEDIGRHFVGEIRKIQPIGPYHLIGFCMGGAVAFEIAQRLIAEEQRVETLALIDTFPPDYPATKSSVPVAFHSLAFAGRGILKQMSTSRDISPKNWLVRLKRMNFMVKEMFRTKDIYRGDRTHLYRNRVKNANLRAFSHYTPQSYKAKIILIMTLDRELREKNEDPRIYWGRLAEGGVNILRISGSTSGSLLKKPHVHGLARALTEHLGNTGTCT